MQNLACRTDAIFHRRDGVIEEHPDYWIIRTPSNPSFWFGNYVLFKQAPRAGDLEGWLEIYHRAFGDTLNHLVLGWDEPVPGALQQFLDAGFIPSHGLALSLTVPPENTRINPELTIRPLGTQDEWEAMVAQQIEVDREDFTYPEDGGVFRRKQMVAAKQMAEAGHGDWWGAFLGAELVGGMGLYFDEGKTVGRFQYVSTAAKHRRQRVCTTILNHVVRHAFTQIKSEVLVICTDAEDDNPAIPTYRNFGFCDAMPNYAFRRPPATATTAKPADSLG